MGAWDTGIFDNDNAADFAASVEYASDVQARHDLLKATMGAVLERDIRPDELTPDYEFGHEIEFALASAAYVADAKNGRHQFTDNAYAMGHVDDDSIDPQSDEAWYHIDLGTPSAELVKLAVETTSKILAAEKAAGVEQEWLEPSKALLKALQEG